MLFRSVSQSRYLHVFPSHDNSKIVQDGGYQMEIPIEQVEIGNTIVVKPGEQIAVDGIVINGNSFVDESMLSGEPVPVLKNENER